jgi:chaperone required for assembly of F1-ATPase
LTTSREPRPKRLYLEVNVAATPEGFAVRLDERGAGTPGGRGLVLPTAALARLVADEWVAQGDRVITAAMPATRLAFVSIDSLPERLGEAAKRVAEFAADDLICYFAEGPAGLVARQEQVWKPLLDWARAELDLGFLRAVGVTHQDQPPATLSAVEALAADQGAFALAGLVHAAELFGSAILALALWKGRLTGSEAFADSQLDETFQAKIWGEDVEAAARTHAMAAEAEMLEAWFRALR